VCLCTDILCQRDVSLNIISDPSNLMFLCRGNYRFKLHEMVGTPICLFVTLNYSLHLNELKFV